MQRVGAVGKDLHFNMAGPGDDLFHIKPAVAKGGQGLGLGLREGLFEFGQAVGNADTAAPAARRCLDHHRKSGVDQDMPRGVNAIHAAQ